MTYIDPHILERFGNNYVQELPNEFRYNCPYCEQSGKTKDTHGHLYVNKKKLVYNCFRCGARGKLSGDIKGYNFDPIPSDTEMASKLGKLLNRNDDKLLYDLSMSTELLVDNIQSSYEEEAFRYLEDRGISPKVCEYYQMRLGNLFSKYRYRIIIPNEITVDKEGVAWTDMFVARYIRPIPIDGLGHAGFPKYLNPGGDNRRSSVFNLHRIRNGSSIIITEGCLTAISAGCNAIATYGKQVTEIQLKKILAKEPKTIFVALDPDAISESYELCKRIRRKSAVDLRVVKLPEGEDANSLGHKIFMEYLFKSEVYDPKLQKMKGLIEKWGIA